MAEKNLTDRNSDELREIFLGMYRESSTESVAQLLIEATKQLISKAGETTMSGLVKLLQSNKASFFDRIAIDEPKLAPYVLTLLSVSEFHMHIITESVRMSGSIDQIKGRLLEESQKLSDRFKDAQNRICENSQAVIRANDVG